MTSSFDESITLQKVLEILGLFDVALEYVLVAVFGIMLLKQTLLVLLLHFLELAGLSELVDVIVHFFIFVILTRQSRWLLQFRLLSLRNGLVVLLNHAWLIFKLNYAVAIIVALQKRAHRRFLIYNSANSRNILYEM